ncbi:putative uncharacterized protein [Clostridium sp. CAG:411]|jgi:glycosyltransferase involved in cell wall biosynthesis|nr:glycosyltransferase family 4 protein [Lachnospiraceae bacterium]CDE45564.1 putative uncharacterized protein [Clostridium sp. CAG:411]
MKALMVASVASMIDQFNRENISLLQTMGYEVDVACNFEVGNTSSEERVKRFRQELQKQEVGTFQLPIPRKILAFSDMIQAYKQLKKMVEEKQYTLVHCHSPIGSVIARLACRKQRKKGLKLIYTAHGFHFFTGAPKKNWLIFYPIEKIFARYTDILITICSEDYQRARKKKLGKNIVYSPGVGIDVDKVKKIDKKADKRQMLGIREKDILVLSVGELNQNKNHETIVRALKQLNRTDVHYVICGQGDKKEELERMAKQFGMEERLHLLGFRTDALEWMKVADLFAFPSYREGLPVSLMEAMAAGLPVVCSKIRGNVDLIKDGEGGYMCEPMDVASFAENLSRLIKDAEQRKCMGEKNQITVQQFDKSRVSEVMKKVYGAV